uniref:Uncharacterized protein n=1 Tax=Schistocephalus solidus TaxID=70667 RepID=A0A0X3NYE6_SCHSO
MVYRLLDEAHCAVCEAAKVISLFLGGKPLSALASRLSFLTVQTRSTSTYTTVPTSIPNFFRLSFWRIGCEGQDVLHLVAYAETSVQFLGTFTYYLYSVLSSRSPPTLNGRIVVVWVHCSGITLPVNMTY